jgi:hypothetical protein
MEEAGRRGRKRSGVGDRMSCDERQRGDVEHDQEHASDRMDR